MDSIINTLVNPSFLFSAMLAMTVTATIILIATPLLDRNDLKKKMNEVALERDRIRKRERERLHNSSAQTPKPLMYSNSSESIIKIIDRFNLRKWLDHEANRPLLMRAGLRGPKVENIFLICRLLTPVILVLLMIAYFLMIDTSKTPLNQKILYVLAVAFVGLRLPNMYVNRLITTRLLSINRAFPDALDLLLICVESGLSIEFAFRKVSMEIGVASIPLAEELTITTAEMSYLSDRRQAYENIADRVNLDSVKSVTTALIQAERYGTPLGQALRVLAQESREQRMTAAEKKAAALSNKLSVPLILFFMPALIIIILTPAGIQVMAKM